MKKYETPEITTITFEVADVICASGGAPDIDGGTTGFLESWLG